MDAPTDQPTTFREWRSITIARYNQRFPKGFVKRAVKVTKMSFSNIKAFLILLSLITKTLPSIAAVLNTETIQAVEVEIRGPDNGIYPLIIFSYGMGGCPADYSGIQNRLTSAG